MKLSRAVTIFAGAVLGTFAAVWLVRHRRAPAVQVGKNGESIDWIELK
ncbi:MAG: hypothetical protein JXB30_04500 [Anaerolineae bacterium]|nr:hypothetical protein [Anaerolineae bacterium]